jgi:adenine-specific DNA-methyltransferase
MASNAISLPREAGLNVGRQMRARGAVYTPTALANWVAQLVLEEGGAKSVLDLGCGEGALLVAAAATVPDARLFGIEINAPAANSARKALGRRAKLLVGDVLAPSRSGIEPLADHWRTALGGAPDAIIMNPPWGAERTPHPNELAKRGLKLGGGQSDSYDLFCELALQIVSPGGRYGFILPDSLFLPEHVRLRELLLRDSEIALIARLGEGMFPGVFRGCVVVIGTRKKPGINHRIECLRITENDRADIFAANDFERCRHRLSHHVLQSRFASDSTLRFDIDVRESDEAIAKMLRAGGGWTNPLAGSRGAEISKSGRVLECAICDTARPLPKVEAPQCQNCGSKLDLKQTRKIISEKRESAGQWRSFIAGEDVSRYHTTSKRWIRTDVKGINYKHLPLSGQPRLLVRKTGVGLKAALEHTGACTNQVVFDYVLRSDTEFNFSYIHYVLGVLCSRILFAFHLKRGGELEWRSHPYVTQKTLAELPIPVPAKRSKQWRQAAAISAAVERHLVQGDCDLEIEALVAGLYQLTAADVRWALDVLDEAADLEPMRTLRLPKSLEIMPVIVS